jgi:2,5-diamino-6-(ribosylamino)-4(3H)-pyrimidinone 5'-phosphate reductase
MRPRIIIHTALSIDGRIDGFEANLGIYYGLIDGWHEDATLVGTGTVLRAMAAEPVDDDRPVTGQARDTADTRPLLVVPDSRGTPAEYLAYARSRRVRTLVHGDDRVDLAAALEDLAEREGVRTVRVDSGGTLNGILLGAGLIDEI